MSSPRRSWPHPSAPILAAILVPALLSASPRPAAAKAAAAGTDIETDTDWVDPTGNFGAQRYAPLDQIDASNVAELVEIWRWTSPDVALREGTKKLQSRMFEPGSHEVSPIKIGDVLYVTTGYSQAAALDPATGEAEWTFDPEAYASGRPPNLGFVHRGAAYWRGDDEKMAGRVLWAGGDARLRAVDAVTGEPIGTFAGGEAVDLTEGMRRQVNRRGYGVNSPVIVCRDTIIVGSNVSDGQASPTGPPGDVRGFDAATGELRWTFESVPQEGDFGNDTWLEESWKVAGNTNVWTLMSHDEELGMVYLPFGTPTNDWYGGHRPGDGLFAESLVALDCASGERKWHFQAVHHGLWDYDLVTAPILGDVNVEGPDGSQLVRGLFQLSKQGFVYALDRVTGEPIWPIEEQPVPLSEVPGEQASPTQPFPSKPPPYERQGMHEGQLNDLTPELLAEAKEIFAKFRGGPLFTPPHHEQPTLNLPGWAGGASWQGGAFDPQTGMLYVPSFSNPTEVQLIAPDPARSKFRYVGRINPIVEGPQGLPLIKPPWARLTAYDLNAGEIAWVRVLGDGPRDHPALAGVDTGPLGELARSHVLATKTLLFVTSGQGFGRGYSKMDREISSYLRVFDKQTGELIHERTLDAHTDGTPITYLHEGRQYLAFALGGREQPQQVVAYALPADRSSEGAP